MTQALQQVGDRTFLLSNGVWVDTTFDSTKMTAALVQFGSERYFALLAAHPELGRYLALGDRVTVIADGKAYAVAPDAVDRCRPALHPPQHPRRSRPRLRRRRKKRLLRREVHRA